jgi:hypothetical protein
MGISNRPRTEGVLKTLIDVLYEEPQDTVGVDLFALCFASENGTMTIGGFNETLHQAEIQFTPINTAVTHYGVKMIGL